MSGRELDSFERWFVTMAASQWQRRLSMVNRQTLRAAKDLQAFGEQLVAIGMLGSKIKEEA